MPSWVLALYSVRGRNKTKTNNELENMTTLVLWANSYTKKAQPPGLLTCIVETLVTRYLASLQLATELDVHANAVLSNQSHKGWINRSTLLTEPLRCMTVLFAVIKLQRCRTIYFGKTGVDTPALCAHPVLNDTTPLPTSQSSCNSPFLIYYIPMHSYLHFSHYSWFITLLLLHTRLQICLLDASTYTFCTRFVHKLPIMRSFMK